MTFSSIPFLFYFFPRFIALYYAVPWKNGALLGAPPLGQDALIYAAPGSARG